MLLEFYMIKKGVFVAFVTILFMFFISSVCAEEIAFEYSHEIRAGNIFLVNITLLDFSLDSYDVKIDIFNSTDSSNRLSEIFNGQNWQSTFNYVSDAINTSLSNKSSFQLNITKNYNGTSNISVSIRNSKDISKVFRNFSIVILPFDLINITNSSINQTTNSTNQTSTNNTTNIQKISSYMGLDWDEEDIVNGEEFYIDIKFFNLEDKNYDLKLWISSENNDNSISDRYDENESKWESGIYWLNNFIKGSGNKTSEVSLRIRSSSKNFYGDAKISAKMRVSGDSDIVNSTTRDITINKNQTDSATSLNAVSLSSSTSYVGNSNSSGLIILGSSSSMKTEDIKTLGNTIYKSKSEYMMEYAPYIMNVLCIFVISFLLFKNYNLIKENKRNKKSNIRNGK